MSTDNTNSSEFTLQPDGTYGYHQLQPDGTYIYYQQLADGAYGYYKPEADGTQAYFRRQDDGTFVQWIRKDDGTYEPPAEAQDVIVDAEIVEETPAAPVIPPAPSAPVIPPAPSATAASALAAPASAPDAPAPVVPYVAPGAQAPAKKGGNKGLLIGAIAAGAVVLLGAGAFGVFTVLKGSGGGGKGVTYVTDFAQEPTEAWTYDYSRGADSDFLWDATVVRVGDDYAIVVPEYDWTAFNSNADGGNTWGYETVWNEDYDAQYDAGWDAAQGYWVALDEYDAALDEWFTNWDAEYPTYPDYEDFWPGTSSFDSVDEAREGGLQDGFLDAVWEYEYGAHKLLKPLEPDFETTVSLIDLRDGKEVWSKTIEEIGGDDASLRSVRDFTGTDYVVVSVFVDDETQLVVLKQSNGERVTTLEPDDYFGTFAARDGWLVVADMADDDTTIKAYKSAALDKGPEWEYEVDGWASLYLYSTFLVAEGDDVEAIDLVTGQPTSFTRALDEDSWLLEVDGALLRIEENTDKGTYEINRIDADGKDQWAKSVKTEDFHVSGDILLVSDTVDDYYTFTKVMRINLKDGTEMWKSPIKGDDYVSVTDPQGDVFYLFSEKRIYQVNAKSGEVVQDVKTKGYSGTLSSGAIYVVEDNKLVALDKKDLKSRWSMKLDDNQWRVVLGTHLLIQDDDEFEIIGLK